jgi:hypothetical protein
MCSFNFHLLQFLELHNFLNYRYYYRRIDHLSNLADLLKSKLLIYVIDLANIISYSKFVFLFPTFNLIILKKKIIFHKIN